MLPPASEKKLNLAAPERRISVFSEAIQKHAEMKKRVREIHETEILIATISGNFSEQFLLHLFSGHAPEEGAPAFTSPFLAPKQRTQFKSPTTRFMSKQQTTGIIKSISFSHSPLKLFHFA